MKNGLGIKIEVTTFHTLHDHVRYNLVVHADDEEYYCSFRYSELFDLFKRLNPKVPNSLMQTLTPFPPKSFWSFLSPLKSKDELSKERLEGFRRFFDQLATLYDWSNTVLKDFLETGKCRHFESLVKSNLMQKTPRMKPRQRRPFQEKLDYVIV